MRKLSSWFAGLSKTGKFFTVGALIIGLFLLIGAMGEPEQKHDIELASGEEQAQQSETETAPVVETSTITEVVDIPYASKTIEDASMYKGESEIRTHGVAGQKELTYEQTVTDGVAGEKVLVAQKLLKEPITQVTAIGTKAKVVAQPPAASNCDSNYTGCVPIASDVDCAGGSGNGPAYVSGPVRVIGYDKYGLDRDGNGIACE